jgi:hypothetical protein
MAFGFFRRNQKMVMIIMAILMVSFLVGVQGIDRILQPKAGNEVIGTTRYGEIKQSDLGAAGNDLRILESMPMLAEPGYRQLMKQQQSATDPEMIFAVIRKSQNPPLTFSLLLQEAQGRKTEVSDQEVNIALEQLGYPVEDQAYKEFVARLRSNKSGNEKQLRQAVKNWLAIYKTALSAVADIPPSDVELKITYKELAEKLSLQVASISADDLAKTSTLTSTPEQIDAQFKAFANVPAGSNNINNPGFGYRLGNRVDIAYIYASQTVLARVLEPNESTLMEYWRSNANDMVDVDQPAASMPTSAPAADAEITTARVRLGDLKQAQARKVIIKLLTPAVVARKMEELFKIVEGIEHDMGPGASADPKQYETIASRLRISADSTMNTPLKTPIQNVSLQQALAILTKDIQDAGVNVRLICFPMGKQGKITIDPSVIVSVENKDQKATVGSALKQISAGLGLSIDNWAGCQTMEDVLFPLPPTQDDYDFFPVVARQTGLLDAAEFIADPILNNCYSTATGTRGAIGEFAFQAEAFYPQAKGAHMKIGQKGLLMFVRGEHPGRLIWKLLDAKLPEQPREITPKISEQIVKDLKLQAAMTQALEKAQAMKAVADKAGLDKAAIADGIKLTDLDLTRKNFNQQYGEFITSPAPTRLGIPYQFAQAFIDAAFKLAPADVEPTTQGYGKSDVIVMPLPALHKVMVIQRTGFTPAVQAEYVRIRPMLAEMAMNLRLSTSLKYWFDPASMYPRLEYKQTRPD